MKVIAGETRYVSGRPVASGAAGGDPGPYTARGIYLGVKAAAKRGLGAEDMKGVHVAIQGVGSVGGGLARLLATDGARLTLADVNADKAKALDEELGAATVDAAEVLAAEADIVSTKAPGVRVTERTTSRLRHQGHGRRA